MLPIGFATYRTCLWKLPFWGLELGLGRPDHIDSKIKAIRYVTGDAPIAYAHEDYFAKEDKHTPCLTICILTLENGFTVTGESACASPENFDKLIGQKLAYENARNKIWQLEGYLLKEKLYQAELDKQF